MRFRCTLDNEIEGALVINNPDGWKDLRIKLERHPKYHSLVEMIEIPFIFYGSNNEVDGGYGYIKRVLETQGFNAIISKQIEISEDEGRTWEDLYEGNLNLEDKEEYSEGDRFFKLKCPITQTGLWSDFVNRNAIPVDMLSATDLNGNDTQIPETIELNLTGQKLRGILDGKTDKQFLAIRNVDYLDITDLSPLTYNQVAYTSFNINEIVQINILDVLVSDEIQERFNVITGNTGGTDAADAAPFLEAKFAGEYAIDLRIEASIYSSCAANNGLGGSGSRQYEISDSFISAGSYFRFYLQVNDNPPFLLDSESSPLIFSKVSTIYTYSGQFALAKGGTLKLYAQIIQDLDNLDSDVGAHPFLPDGTEIPPLGLGTVYTKDNINYLFFWGEDNSALEITHYNHAEIIQQSAFSFYYLFGCDFSGSALDAGDAPSSETIPTYLNITADTLFEDTVTDALLIHDAAKSIVHRITGIPNNSFYSEKLGGTIQGYDFDGCDYRYALMRGLHVRGYSFADKPFFMSFDDFWEGADPIFNLGCGYEDMPDLEDDYEAAYTIGFSLGFES